MLTVKSRKTEAKKKNPRLSNCFPAPQWYGCHWLLSCIANTIAVVSSLDQRISSVPTSIWREGEKRTQPGSFQWCPVLEQKTVGTNWNSRGFIQTPGALLCSQVTEHLHRFSRDCRASYLVSSKSRLDTILAILLWVSLLEQGLSQMDPEVPFNLRHWLCL